MTARIVQMDRIDIGLFDYDRHNTLYFFLLNADEQIYMRYGGRDPAAVDTYLNLESLELALRQGLELHERYKRGELPKTERPKPDFAENYPLLVERTIGRGACVECHLIADYQALHKERDGTLDKLRDMYRSPDIKTIGVHLDVPKGLLVARAEGPAAAAGMLPGDTITHVEGARVYTFGDLQYRYDKVPREATSTRWTVDREGRPVDLTIELPPRWWLTELVHRHWTIEPRVYFKSRQLSSEEKRELMLPEEGFAGRVSEVEGVAGILGLHELKKGDIVYAVDGVETDPIAHTPELYLRLRTTSGSTAMLGVIRDGRRMELPLKSARMGFRK